MGENIVVGAVLRFEHASRLEVRERVRTYLLEKRRVQPVTEWSAGCVFKNPDPELSGGRSAGKLVDDCGGKSRQRGDAIVSPLHGNFIVNQGAATSADVLTLIEDLRDLVAQKTGLRLETEVKIWG
jgi:UDP-N-acetylmuramate dehydrogenase